MAIDRSAKAYSIICPDCKAERFLTYAQAWNIKRKNSTGRCMKCRSAYFENGSETRFSKGISTWNKGLIGYQKGHKPYFRAPGDRNPAWKGGVTSASMKIRNSPAYAEWRKKVFERDSYTCKICNQRGGKLCADHIKPFAHYPDLRLEPSNGRTLCEECHKQTDTYLSKAYRHAV